MRTRGGVKYGERLRHADLKTGIEFAKKKRREKTKTIEKSSNSTSLAVVTVESSARPLVTLVAHVSLARDGTVVPFMGREPWHLTRETSRARVYVGRDWTVRPWDDANDDSAREFVARFRSGGGEHVVHVSDRETTVRYLVSALNEVVPASVLGLGSRACGILRGDATLRELAERERRAYTMEDLGEIIVFTT